MRTQDFFSQFNILFLALIGGQILFAGVAFYLVSQGFAEGGEDLVDTFRLIVPILAIGVVFGVRFLYGKRLEQAKNEDGLKAKLNQYRAAFILKIALYESASLFSILAYMLTGYQLFIIIAAVIIAFQFTHIPSKEKTIRELELKGEEKNTLEAEDALLD